LVDLSKIPASTLQATVRKRHLDLLVLELNLQMNSADEVVLESINNRIRSLVECAEELVRRKQRVHIDLAKLTPVVRGKLEKAIGESRVLGPKAIEGRQKREMPKPKRRRLPK